LGQLLLSKGCYCVKPSLIQNNSEVVLSILYYPLFTSINNDVGSLNYFNLKKLSKLAGNKHKLYLLKEAWGIMPKLTSRSKLNKKQVIVKQQLSNQIFYKFSKLAKLRLSNAVSKRFGVKVKVQCLNVLRYLYNVRKLSIKSFLSFHFDRNY